MTATTLRPGATQRQHDELRSFAAVIVLLAVAVVGGLLLRVSVEGAVTRVDSGGLDATVPAGWVVLPPAGDRLLTAYDPLDPDLRYGLSAVDGAEGATLTPEDAAARRLQDRRQLLQGFTIVSEGTGSIGAAATYDVRYTFVDPVPGGSPTTIEALEHYLPDGAIFPQDRVLVIALEAPPGAIEAARSGLRPVRGNALSPAGVQPPPSPRRRLRPPATGGSRPSKTPSGRAGRRPQPRQISSRAPSRSTSRRPSAARSSRSAGAPGRSISKDGSILYQRPRRDAERSRARCVRVGPDAAGRSGRPRRRAGRGRG